MTSSLVVGTNTYVSQSAADTYLGDTVRAANWATTSPEAKAQALISATKILDRQLWQGTKTSGAQALQWPRTGVTDKYGSAVDPSVVHQQVKDAECELAFDLSQDSSLEESGGQGTNTKRLAAGSASIEYFRPTGGVNGEGSARFPANIMELIREFLAGSVAGLSGSYSSGTGVESSFDPSPTFGLNQGLP